jgi:TetR/AcrR family transcriptional regulator, transcriptional repressor for nem operon
MQLFHEQGFQRTTLSHVAQLAGVPAGNVYYYFKTKEALAQVVIGEHERSLRETFGALTKAHGDARDRLRLFIRAPLGFADRVVRFGCAHTSLCQELEKLAPESALPKASQQLMAAYLEWVQSQFEVLGFDRAEAQLLAADLVGAVKGAMLLAHGMQSEEILSRQLQRVEKWFDAVAAGEPAPVDAAGSIRSAGDRVPC